VSGAPDPDVYRSIRTGPEVEIRVRGSRFVAIALAVDDESEARAHLDRVRRRDHDATHHCSAYRIGPPGAVRERFDDDGEPASTAGKPILTAIAGRRIHDVLVVVTRWFGGTKLGTGGLARAYGQAGADALDAAVVREIVLRREIRVECDFERLGPVEALLAREAAAVLGVERRFEPDPVLRVAVRRSRGERLARGLVEATAGRARVELEPEP
jgi:uncharacterized YigZ family protein